MRASIATLCSLVLLAVIPAAAGASGRAAVSCSPFKVAGEVFGSKSFTQIRVTNTSCREARRVARLWLSNLDSGTRRQRLCKAGTFVPKASCAVGAYVCLATDLPGTANRVSCRSGARRVSWRVYFDE